MIKTRADVARARAQHRRVFRRPHYHHHDRHCRFVVFTCNPVFGVIAPFQSLARDVEHKS